MDHSVDTKYAAHRDGNFWALKVRTGAMVMNIMHVLLASGSDSIDDLPDALALV